MSTRSNFSRAFAFLAAVLLSATAHAQLFRTYLAPTGSDANPCSLQLPCRLLPAALNAVVSGGEIWMLDSANYNTSTVTIGKSVSILAVPGAVGSVVAIGGPAITITAAGLNVALRNLVIVPLAGAGGTDGVYMTGASDLTIENSLIANLPVNGVYVIGTGKVTIADTILRKNTGFAVHLENGSTGVFSKTQMLGNGEGGILASTIGPAPTTGSVNDSLIHGGVFGVAATSNGMDAFTKIFVTRSSISGTNHGLYSETALGSSLVTVSYSTVTGNGNGWNQSGTSVIKSLGNNHIEDNLATIGMLTTVVLK